MTEIFSNPINDTELEGMKNLLHRKSSESTLGSGRDLVSHLQHYENVGEASFEIGNPFDEQMMQTLCLEDYNWKALGSSIEIPVDFRLPKRRKSKQMISEESLYFDYALSDSESNADHESLYQMDSDSSFITSSQMLMRHENVPKDVLEKAVEEEKHMEPSLEQRELVDCFPSRKVVRGSLRKKIEQGLHSILIELNIPNVSDPKKRALSKIENSSYIKDDQLDDEENTSNSEALHAFPGGEDVKFDQFSLSSSQRKTHEIYTDDNKARQEYIRMLEQEVVGLKLKLADAQGSLDLVNYLQRDKVEQIEKLKTELKNLQNINTGKPRTCLPVESINKKCDDGNFPAHKMRHTFSFFRRPKC